MRPASITSTFLLILLIAGCGGDSTPASDSQPLQKIEQEVNRLEGSVYTGSPMQGSISITNGSKVESYPVDANGRFSINTTMQGPFKIVATSTDHSIKLYSYSLKAGYINVNPMTTAIIYNATKILPQEFHESDRVLSQSEIIEAEMRVQAALGRTLLANGIQPNSGLSFFETSFEPNHSGLDGVLDSVKVATSSAGIVVFPREGLPIDLKQSLSPYNYTSEQLRAAGITRKLLNGTIKWSAKDSWDFLNDAIEELEVEGSVQTIVDGGKTYNILKGASSKAISSKMLDSVRIAFLDFLFTLGAITADEEEFLSKISDDVLSEFVLSPVIRVYLGQDAAGTISKDLWTATEKTRPGKYMQDVSQAYIDSKTWMNYLQECLLPTRVLNGLILVFAPNAEDLCGKKGGTSPFAQFSMNEKDIVPGVVVDLDASDSFDYENFDLIYDWTVDVESGDGKFLLIDSDRVVAKIFPIEAASDTILNIRLTVYDMDGKMGIQERRLSIKASKQIQRSSSFCGQLLDFNSSKIPDGWDEKLIRNGPGLDSDLLTAIYTDSGVALQSPISAMGESFKSILIHYDSYRGESAYGQAGTFNMLLRSGKYFQFSSLNGLQEIGAGFMDFRVYTGNGRVFAMDTIGADLIESTRVPVGLGKHQWTISISEDKVKWIYADASGPNSITMNIPSDFRIDDIVSAGVVLYKTTGEPISIDNLSFECLI